MRDLYSEKDRGIIVYWEPDWWSWETNIIEISANIMIIARTDKKLYD